MLNEYLYEIITLIVILTAVVIYFLTRKFNQEELDSFESTQQRKSNPSNDLPGDIEEDVIVPEFTPATIDEDETFTLNDNVEGSFGNINNNPFEETSPNITQTTQETVRKKVIVPEHGKITKSHFKDFKGVKLLVAEDNLINQKVITGLLNDSGIEITIADDGQIALEILEKNSDFDIILMDAHMPRVDGYEATRIIRANSKYEHIVVVALSGDVAADDIRKMQEAGMEEHLEKPLRMEAFYDILYAYTKANNMEKPDDSIEIVMTKELNGDKGLSVCGGDEEFYKDILNEFINTYTNTSSELLELLQNSQVQRADALLLDFIGITANIGADTIKDVALELKELIKDTEEKSYITILDDFEVHLEALLKDIQDYLT